MHYSTIATRWQEVQLRFIINALLGMDFFAHHCVTLVSIIDVHGASSSPVNWKVFNQKMMPFVGLKIDIPLPADISWQHLDQGVVSVIKEAKKRGPDFMICRHCSGRYINGFGTEERPPTIRKKPTLDLIIECQSVANDFGHINIGDKPAAAAAAADESYTDALLHALNSPKGGGIRGIIVPNRPLAYLGCDANGACPCGRSLKQMAELIHKHVRALLPAAGALQLDNHFASVAKKGGEQVLTKLSEADKAMITRPSKSTDDLIEFKRTRKGAAAAVTGAERKADDDYDYDMCGFGAHRAQAFAKVLHNIHTSDLICVIPS